MGRLEREAYEGSEGARVSCLRNAVRRGDGETALTMVHLLCPNTRHLGSLERFGVDVSLDGPLAVLLWGEMPREEYTRLGVGDPLTVAAFLARGVDYEVMGALRKAVLDAAAGTAVDNEHDCRHEGVLDYLNFVRKSKEPLPDWAYTYKNDEGEEFLAVHLPMWEEAAERLEREALLGYVHCEVEGLVFDPEGWEWRMEDVPPRWRAPLLDLPQEWRVALLSTLFEPEFTEDCIPPDSSQPWPWWDGIDADGTSA
jgi:hypothetical protein